MTGSPRSVEPRADLDDLLGKTSRTFALAIPLLPDALRRQVSIAYLLFRIADTFEDSVRWSRRKRIDAIADLVRLLEGSSGPDARRLADGWARDVPDEHPGYLELVRATPQVLDALDALEPRARTVVTDHTVRTAELMASYVARSDGDRGLWLIDLVDLREYCYAVAGLVGKMLTELFLLEAPSLGAVRRELRDRSVPFGEALQLVNILKDSRSDAEGGRHYLPPTTDRAEVLALARADLEVATRYVGLLEATDAPRGVVAFTALPVLLARAALRRLDEAGPGAKVSREEVFTIVDRMNRALDAGAPALGDPVSRRTPRPAAGSPLPDAPPALDPLRPPRA